VNAPCARRTATGRPVPLRCPSTGARFPQVHERWARRTSDRPSDAAGRASDAPAARSRPGSRASSSPATRGYAFGFHRPTAVSSHGAVRERRADLSAGRGIAIRPPRSDGLADRLASSCAWRVTAASSSPSTMTADQRFGPRGPQHDPTVPAQGRLDPADGGLDRRRLARIDPLAYRTLTRPGELGHAGREFASGRPVRFMTASTCSALRDRRGRSCRSRQSRCPDVRLRARPRAHAASRE